MITISRGQSSSRQTKPEPDKIIVTDWDEPSKTKRGPPNAVGEHFFFEAMQRIDFALRCTGVILRCEAPPGVARRRERHEPRRLHFNRPFLITGATVIRAWPKFFLVARKINLT
jgi:hypothetical protein